MRTLVFLLEEPSAQEMLEGLLPRILPASMRWKCIVFQGKQSLEKHLVLKLRHWQLPDSDFIVLRDQDSGDCLNIKSGLVEKCRVAGKPSTLVRIACRELESFYLGDLRAVELGLGVKGLQLQQGKSKYREPDKLVSPSTELEILTKGQYQKRAGSRAIAPHLDLSSNRSRSFNVLLQGISVIASRGMAI
ncbi:MAG: DUF4276 family protein [Humidesulfovibrio sp.]|nr:DUF4276 family protein [Humidesulfovibrio sp.]